MKIFNILGVLLASACVVQSYRILGIFPLPGKSHYILGSSLMRALAEQGHDVTVLSPFGEKVPPKEGKYRDIILTNLVKFFEAMSEKEDDKMNMFENSDSSPFIQVPMLAAMISQIGELTFQSEEVQNLINSNETFDAVIIEQFINDAHKSLAPHFGAVQIVFSALYANYWINPLVGNPSPLSYIPDLFLSYSPHMTFCERVSNTLFYLLNVALHHLYLFPKHNAVSQKYIPNAPDFYKVLYNSSLVLLNSHPSISQPVPHVPNMKEIGGFHIKPPKKLPKELQEFLDNAKDGVIYFSLGSNLQSSELPEEKRDAILNTFSKLKEQVLWKWETDVLPGQPKNVRLEKWLPQTDVLAHPNVKLFITHGGLLSTTETIYHGKPVLAIPVYGDQKLNAQSAVDSGFGLSLPYSELNEEKFSEKLNELLTNSKYAENAKIKSKLFHDREVKPMDSALYWIEYVIRHDGAPHLKVAAVDLPWYQYFLLDVIAAIGVTIFIGICIIKFVIKKLCIRKSAAPKKDRKKQKLP